MHVLQLVFFVLPFAASVVSAAAAPRPTPAPAPALEERQDYSALIALASLAGIPIPTTDPALLLSLGPLAAQLASDLPTAPVLSVLETAAPSGFLSNIVHNPTFAAGFESQFAEGPSPSWFLALPSSVRAYLHTYDGLATVAGDVGSVVQEISSATRTAGTVTTTETSSGGGGTTVETLVTSATGNNGMGTSAVGMSAGTMTTTTTVTGSGSAGSAGAATRTSSSSAGAARETTPVLAVGMAAVAGVLGLAIAL